MRSNRLACLLAVLAASTATPALAADFPLAPHQMEVGAVGSHDMQPGEVFVDVARQFDLGFIQMIAANPGVDPWLAAPGHRLALPGIYLLPDGPRRGIVINLAEERLYYFPPNGKSVETYPIGVGVLAGATPLGVTRVVAKEDGPVWVPPPSIRAEEPDLPASIPPGPADPLGAYALRLGWNNYLIHGTNHPYGIGRDVSHGCIRLYPEDIDKLFHEVPVGTSVRTVYQQVKVAWVDDRLLVQVFPDKARIGAIDLGKDVPPTMPPDLVQRVMAAAGDLAPQVDWDKVNALGLAQSGIPTAVLDRPLVSSIGTPDTMASRSLARSLADETVAPHPADRRRARAGVAADPEGSE